MVVLTVDDSAVQLVDYLAGHLVGKKVESTVVLMVVPWADCLVGMWVAMMVVMLAVH